MMPATWLPLLLADQDRLNGMASHFRKGSVNFTNRDMMILLGIVAVLSGIIWLLARIVYGKERKIYNRPRSLFRELCRAHGLDSPSRRLLAELAKSQGLAQPAELFLAPERFDSSRLGKKFALRQSEIGTLAEKLFSNIGPAK